jgi:hypothetical protein
VNAVAEGNVATGVTAEVKPVRVRALLVGLVAGADQRRQQVVAAR